MTSLPKHLLSFLCSLLQLLLKQVPLPYSLQSSFFNLFLFALSLVLFQQIFMILLKCSVNVKVINKYSLNYHIGHHFEWFLCYVFVKRSVEL